MPVRESLTNPMLSLAILCVYGGIGDFVMSKTPSAGERAVSKCHRLVGNIKCLCWYQRLQRIKDCSVPVREQPLSRWKVLHRYREVDDFQEVPQISQQIPPRRFNKSPRHQIWMYTNTESLER
jgi:hypothetical protein